MGREIRMVIPNWKHQKGNDDSYQPMYDDDFDSSFTRWCNEYELWKKGEHPDQKNDITLASKYKFWEWCGGPPDPKYFRPAWSKEEASWVQVYETVSEGTPVSPPFATKEELVN